jgi:PAT family beta-lactamase induction signal transducer AmpG
MADPTPTPAAPDPNRPGPRRPWAWVPSLYYAEGLPYVVVMILSVILYKRLGVSNTDIALYTSWLYLPWVIKPFWAPIVEVLGTKRLWIVAMQLVVGAGLAGVALTIPAEPFFQYTLAFLWLLAFASATHDIAADGFYLLALDEGDQSLFVGIRSTFYRAAMITGQGLIVILAGALEASTGLPPADLTVRAAAEAPAPGSPGAPAPEDPAAIRLPLSEGGTPAPDSTALFEQAVGADSAAPAEAPAPPVVAEDGPLRLVLSDSALVLPLAGTAPDAADALKAEAHAANLAAGVIPAEPEAAAGAEPEGPSWWGRAVSGPFGDFLRRTVGREPAEAPTATRAGAVGSVGVRLSGPVPAGEELVVHVGRDDGAKEVNVVEGERLTFTADNWDRPARVVFAVDHRLDTPAEATFRATSGDLRFAWSTTFWTLAALFVGFTLYHRFALPRPAVDAPQTAGRAGLPQYLGFLVLFIPVLAVVLVPMLVWGLVGPLFGRREGPWGRLFAALPFSQTPFARTIVTFFEKPGVGAAVAFMLLYRFAEAQQGKLGSPFLLDAQEAGGLNLSTGEVGLVYGTVGILALTLGGILGGVLASRHGLRKWFWPMVAAMNLPNAVYVYLAVVRPESLAVVNAAIAVEQFGYGLGFTAFMLYLIHFADGPHKTAHYAICTGFMALGMMIPGMFSGWLQEILGYERFFVWVMIATVPSFLVAALVRFPADFGRKRKGDEVRMAETEGAAVEA